MIDRDHGLSIGRQAKVLGISRGSVHYLPRATSDADLALMRRIDELHLEYPLAGSRMLKGLSQAEGHQVGRLHVSTPMKGSRDRRASGAAQARRTAIEAPCRPPNASKPAPGHKVYPYLPRNVAVTRPNQAWAMNIT
jgi:putative transposase